MSEQNRKELSPEELELMRISETTTSLVAFREYYLSNPRDVEAAPYHHRWSQLLLRSREHVAIQGFRESAKDQYVFQANILHALTYPTYERSYIVLIAGNATQASQKLKDITRQFQARNNERMRFNLAKIIEDSGDAFQAEYNDGMQVRIEAYGKGASIRGIVWGSKRPDIVILNDIQDVEDMDSPSTLEKDWKWFLSDVKFLGYSSRIFIIGNNMGPNCVIERIFARARELDFLTERVTMITKDGKAAWPARFPIEFCNAERQSYENMGEIDIWERERMCRPMAEESHPLKFDQLEPYEELDIDTSDMNIITMTDPGISEKKDADPTVVITVGIAQNNHWYILDVDRRRRNPTEQINDIFRAVARYRPTSVGVETVAYQEALAHFLEIEQKKRDIYFNIVRVRTRGNKVAKIRGRLQPMIRSGMIHYPKHASWVRDFKEEIESFPVGKHDDIIDALSMIEDARAELLVPDFNTRTCIGKDMPIPAHWPLWASLVSDINGESVMLLCTCSPDGQITVVDQIFAKVSPEVLFYKYKLMTGGREVISIQTTASMFKEKGGSPHVKADAYRKVGFKLTENNCDYVTMLPVLSSYFSTIEHNHPKLKISPKCKRLLWELYNAVEGELKDDNRKSIQALLLLISAGIKWRDMNSKPLHYSRKINYPEADIP